MNPHSYLYIADARNGWEDNLPEDEDPESYIQPLEELLSALEREFSSGSDIVNAVRKEQFPVRRWIERANQDIAERKGDEGWAEPDYDSGSYTRSQDRSVASERSIFDDIDI